MKSFSWCLLLLLSTSPSGAQSLGSSPTKENLDLPINAGLVVDDVEDEDAPEIITFYSQQYEGDGVFFTIDRSGSMWDRGELDIAKREVAKNIMQFSEQMEFAVIFFDREILKWPDSGRPARAGPASKQAAIAWTRSVEGGGGSCAQQGLMEALKFANRSAADRKVVIYVGDGGGYCHGANELEYLAQTLAVVKSQNVHRAQINAIGVLRIKDVSDQFLRRLTSQNDGSYTKVSR